MRLTYWHMAVMTLIVSGTLHVQAAAAETVFKIRGIVRSDHGAPVAGLVVRAFEAANTTDRKKLGEASTDEHGAYVITCASNRPAAGTRSYDTPVKIQVFDDDNRTIYESATVFAPTPGTQVVNITLPPVINRRTSTPAPPAKKHT